MVSSQGLSDASLLPVGSWSCRYLTWPEVIVEQGGCLRQAVGMWLQCVENDLWCFHDGVHYILRDLVYCIRPVPVEEENNGHRAA